jgi:4a-hydroxytetrahydrobiopterin dehydratase
MAATPLAPEQVRAALLSLPGWAFSDNALDRTFTFADFRAALEFMHACVEDIDRRDHHPQWTNVYNRVTVRLTTHDAGNRVTAQDVELAKVLAWQAGAHGAA